MTEGDPGVRETTKLDPVSEQQHSGGAKPATRPANFADDSHTRLSSCTHNRNRKITFSSDKRTPDLSDGSLFPSGDRDADSTTAAVTDSEVDRRNSSSLHLTYLPRSGFSEAQILKRCRRSSVLCCRCRETPVPPPAVDEEEGGKGASVGHLRQLAGSHAAVEGQGHDCCSCCYCSCGSRDHHPKQPTASCLSSSPPRSSSKTADWPCTSRIICIEGPSRPDTFESNLRKLSEEFPAIHQGVSSCPVDFCFKRCTEMRLYFATKSFWTTSLLIVNEGMRVKGVSLSLSPALRPGPSSRRAWLPFSLCVARCNSSAVCCWSGLILPVW